ncbi:MAG: hypothetical protein JJE23_07150 [Thermoleophilia bacterium]|nr:hypothetical protein [Thermoleophilia bacterium]
MCKWYLENAPRYAGRFKHVWLWDDWPDRWGAEAGIDLVAEEHPVRLAGRSLAHRLAHED